MNIQDALGNLNSYLDNADTRIEDWNVSEYRDSWVFSVREPARSNTLYIVKGGRVKSYAPSSQTIEEAYSELA